MTYLNIVAAHALSQPIRGRSHIGQSGRVDELEHVIDAEFILIPVRNHVIEIAGEEVIVVQVIQGMAMVREAPQEQIRNSSLLANEFAEWRSGIRKTSITLLQDEKRVDAVANGIKAICRDKD